MKKNTVNLINEVITTGKDRGILHLYAEDPIYNGRTIHVKGKELVNFGSYSYLGLETDQRLKEGAIDAIRRFGTQYPSSRSYMSCSLYLEMEELLRKIFGAPVVFATSTTIGHQAVLPVVVNENDAVILDQQVHASVQEAANRLQLYGANLTIVRHNKISDLEIKIRELAEKHDKVWYMADGVYSMYGDTAPLEELERLLNKYKTFHLYIDDAHGMSWAGKNGAGYALSQIKLHPRMILATSLNKAFSAGGAVFVIPDQALCEKVRNCGGPLIFAGQHQTSALGAGIACARIHLSDEIYERQRALHEKMAYCSELLINKHKLPVISSPHTPIFFVGVGIQRMGYNIVKRMVDDGCYTNLAIFPAVPETCTGVRFTITNHHTMRDIEDITLKLAYNFSRALRDEKHTIKDIQHAFRRVEDFVAFVPHNEQGSMNTSGYHIQHERSIKMIDEEEWNTLFSSANSYDWNGIRLLEEAFTNNESIEDNWSFHYVIIRDHAGKPVFATYMTAFLSKDDMMAPANVSEQIERERSVNPYYLTSRTLMTGSLLSLGNHIYLDTERDDWRQIMKEFLVVLGSIKIKEQINTVNLRDFSPDQVKLRDFFMDHGFMKLMLPSTHQIRDIHINLEEYLSHLKSDKRYYIKKRALKWEHCYDVEVVTKPEKKQVLHYYNLYKNIHQKSFELNEFPFPVKLFEKIAKNDKWEILDVKLKPGLSGSDQPKTVGFAMSYINGDTYHFLITGMDYEFLSEYELYTQILWRIIKRASELGLRKIELGVTASQNKRKFGGKVIPIAGYVQVEDQYNQVLINSMINKKMEA